jgi:hypothetical protein
MVLTFEKNNSSGARYYIRGKTERTKEQRLKRAKAKIQIRRFFPNGFSLCEKQYQRSAVF